MPLRRLCLAGVVGEPSGGTFQPESKPEGRTRGCVSSWTCWQRASSPVLSLLCFRSLRDGVRPTRHRPICFTVPANSDGQVFWKLSYASPWSNAPLSIRAPVAQTSRTSNSPSHLYFFGPCPMSTDSGVQTQEQPI